MATKREAEGTIPQGRHFTMHKTIPQKNLQISDVSVVIHQLRITIFFFFFAMLSATRLHRVEWQDDW
jgi:hypothetical protein